ncbi:hypothetical protein [Mesobacterium pallidum]|uniref:hypothetical protein n=1 Tax=Mesobacterium pallidum TaxID=2872037 RepID=UPI001EE34281|nr:hypothetical protein [Mesobacterium pallidum]
MFTNQIALILRVALLYPFAGAAGLYSCIDFDQATGLLTIDLSAASIVVAGLISGSITGGTFAWSRIAKKLGGAT